MEYMKTFDWPWSKELYEMQWQYPYVLDIAYSPESHRLDEPMMPEAQIMEQQPTAPAPVANTAVPPAMNTATAQSPTPPTAPNNKMGVGMENIKPFIAPALLIIGGVLLYQFLKKK